MIMQPSFHADPQCSLTRLQTTMPSTHTQTQNAGAPLPSPFPLLTWGGHTAMCCTSAWRSTASTSLSCCVSRITSCSCPQLRHRA